MDQIVSASLDNTIQVHKLMIETVYLVYSLSPASTPVRVVSMMQKLLAVAPQVRICQLIGGGHEVSAAPPLRGASPAIASAYADNSAPLSWPFIFGLFLR
jgi:hypothetical protein